MKHLTKVGIAFVRFTLMTPMAVGVDPVEVIAFEGDKEALNLVFKVAKSKPALSIAAGITCVACIPIVDTATSPGLYITCGILIVKTLD